MRRALIVTVGTAAAVVGIIQYRSSGNARALLNVGKTTATTAASSTQAASHTSMSVAPGTTMAPATTTPGVTMPGATTTPTTAPATIPATTRPLTTMPRQTLPPTTKGPNGQFVGSTVQFVYGKIEARVTFRSGKIVAVDFPIQTNPDPTSAQINSKALPILTRDLISSQTIHLDGVTGATFTSRAFAQTVQAALSKAGL
jgi:uncharacterized protein with FMN-binding domain